MGSFAVLAVLCAQCDYILLVSDSNAGHTHDSKDLLPPKTRVNSVPAGVGVGGPDGCWHLLFCAEEVQLRALLPGHTFLVCLFCFGCFGCDNLGLITLTL